MAQTANDNPQHKVEVTERELASMRRDKAFIDKMHNLLYSNPIAAQFVHIAFLKLYLSEDEQQVPQAVKEGAAWYIEKLSWMLIELASIR